MRFAPELAVVFVVLAMSVLLAWPAGRICRRAGFTPWLGVFILIPFANILLLWFLALARWPTVPSPK